MSEYTQGVCHDGAAILRDGQPLTIEQILEALRECDALAAKVLSLQASGDGLLNELEQWSLTEGDPESQAAIKSWCAARNTPPKGACLVPRAITAETGHKAGMMGDFTETIALDCVHCDAEGCEECQDTGQHLQHITVSWTTIKAIHQRIVEIAEGHQ